MSKWTKTIKEIIRDIAIGFLINGAMISIPAAIQQKVTPGFDKFFGMIEIGFYECIAVFLSSTGLLLYFKRKQVGKYLDELTGKAKGERESRERLELANIESKERLELDTRKRMEREVKEAEEARSKIEEENKKKQKLEEKEREEKDKLDELLSLIRENSRLLASKIENKGVVTPLSNILHHKKIRLKLNIRLRAFGFDMPSEEEMADENFDVWWCTFLSLLEVVIEEGDYKKELNLWKGYASGLKKLPKNP